MKRPLVVAAVLVLVAFGRSALPARAMPTELVGVNCVFLLDVGDGCKGGISEGEVAMLSGADGVLQPSEIADLAAMSAPQVSVPGSANIELALFAFVDDDAPVLFDVPLDLSLTYSAPGFGDFACDGQDEDCDDDGITGDGVIPVVVRASLSAVTDIGAAAAVDVSQAGANLTFEVLIVGEPARIAIFESEEVVSAAGADCADATVEAANDLDKLLLEAVVTDAALNQLVGMPVHWDVDDPSIALIDPLSFVTYNNGVGISQPAILCGQDQGDVVVTATIDVGALRTTSVTKTVVGEPANINLSAEPSVIDCNGTNSSTVTAVVTDADGNPVVPGTPVAFEVVALGTADPTLTTTDATGTASSTVTPLSIADAGIIVTVTSGLAAEQIRIDCAATPTERPAEQCLSAGHKNALARNVERRLGSEIGERGYNAHFDITGDGAIDVDDVAAVAQIPVCEHGPGSQ